VLATVPTVDRDQFVAVRDSGAIRIVELSSGYADALPRWQIAPEPDLTVGKVEGEPPYLFGSIGGAAVRSDGTLVVADVMASNVRFFDSRGQFLGQSGRKGRGPGEFSNIQQMLRIPGDTVVIWDEVGARITWIGPSGELSRVETRPGPRTFHVGALLADGSRVIPVYPDLVQPTVDRVLWRPNGRIAYVDQPTGRIDTLGTFLGAEQATGGMTPVRRDTRFATNGFTRSFATGDNERFDIILYDIRGSDTPIREAVHIRELFEPGPVTERYVQEWRERTREAYRGHPREEEVERDLQSPVVPPTFPAYEDLIMDVRGFLWVERFRAAPQMARLVSVFDLTGMPVARAEYPEGLTVLEIGGDYVLGTFADSLDVLSVRKYRLARRPLQ
jgi:hypothetical protein